MDGKLVAGFVVLIAIILALAASGDDAPAANSPAACPTCPGGWHCDERGCFPNVPQQQPSRVLSVQRYGDLSSSYESYYTGQARPAVDLPYELRKKNWGGGSCVHASTITLLRWLADGSGDADLFWLADNWPYSGGEDSSRHRERVERANLKYVMTVDGDEELVKWAIITRRGCALAHDGHCYNAVGFDQQTGEIITLDNNHTQRYDYTAWGEKIKQWQRGGGWCFAFVYSPPAPLPTIR